jgi:hypothetical protein
MTEKERKEFHREVWEELNRERIQNQMLNASIRAGFRYRQWGSSLWR